MILITDYASEAWRENCGQAKVMAFSCWSLGPTG